MTDRPFRVVDGGGKPKPDERVVSELETLLKRAKSGEIRRLMVVADPLDGEPEIAVAGDNPIRALALAELMIPQAKAFALGLEIPE